ncbi:MAG: AAA family ATPase [Acutalibacter sp.]|jgi:adenylate kinase family enzyme
MPEGILIFGPSGAGKTTLGRRVAQELGVAFLDIDDYIWRKDTPKPFSTMYSREEKISRLREAVFQAGRFVMAGSMDSFHQHFDPFFRLAVYLDAPASLRVERVHQRELEQFGSRVLPGGDMEEDHRRFLQDVAGYDQGAGGATRQSHQAWINSLRCKVITLDGSNPIKINEDATLMEWRKVIELVRERETQ